MKTKQQGFTLIELVVVIVLLGILGAAATARFQDLGTDAANAALRGVAAEISSGGALNMAERLAGTAGVAVAANPLACDTYANARLFGGGVTVDPNNAGTSDFYIEPAGATVNCSLGQATPVMPSCNLRHKDGTLTTVTFTVFCVL